MIVVASVTAASNPAKLEVTANDNVELITYIDPRFDFTIDYPANWIVLPRGDNHGGGATIAFTSEANETADGADPHNAPAKVEIGLYLVAWSERERLPDRSLKEWTKRYNELSRVSGTESQLRQSRRIR